MKDFLDVFLSDFIIWRKFRRGLWHLVVRKNIVTGKEQLQWLPVWFYQVEPEPLTIVRSEKY